MDARFNWHRASHRLTGKPQSVLRATTAYCVMNDDELNELRVEFPENYYMDGELSEKQAHEYWKKQPRPDWLDDYKNFP